MVLDDGECCSSKALLSIGSSPEKIVCPNNTETCIKIRESGLCSAIPLDVQTYLSGKYKRWFKLRKFSVMYLDYCGELGQLKETPIFENLQDYALLAITLTKRGVTNIKRNIQKIRTRFNV